MSRWPHAIALVSILAAGCSEKSEPPRRPQGLLPGEEVPRGPVPTPAPEAPAPAPPRSSLPSPFLKSAPNPGSLTRADAAIGGEGAAQAALAEVAADAGEARDLSSELLALMGHPAKCVDFAEIARTGGLLNITMTVQVTPSGRITRATATAPGQSAEALRCLEKGVTTARFRGPVEGAPREVTTTLPLQVVAQPAR